MGEFDGCVVFEAPYDTTATALLLKLGHADNVRLLTLRVFDAAEFEKCLRAIG